MQDKIHETYKELKQELNGSFNDALTREYVKVLLAEKLNDLKITEIKCDEENNPPDVIDNNNINARVWFSDGIYLKYIDFNF
jgi:hypothetical protein